MNFKEFEKLKENIENWDSKDKQQLIKIIDDINIETKNFDRWVESVFSEDVLSLDLNKLPYLIDALYQTNNKFKFMLCCMLIESTCDKIPFLTNLEEYPLFVEKYKELVNTIVTVYESCDNGIADCMSLIVLNNDPKFEFMLEKEKKRMIDASCEKLKAIINYLNNSQEISNEVFSSLEIIIDLCCGLNSPEIDELIMHVPKMKLNNNCKIFIVKYFASRNLPIEEEYIKDILSDTENVEKIYKVLEKMKRLDVLSNENITQELIAKSNMINWLKYPTELGKKPDIIENIGKIELEDYECYIYKFKSIGFRINDYMLGISGPYPKNNITAVVGGYTFSKFEKLEEDYLKQANSIITMISNHYNNRK